MSRNEIAAELATWLDRLAEAKSHRWADGITHCSRHVRQLRRMLAQAS